MTQRHTLTHLDCPSCGGISLTHKDLRQKNPVGKIFNLGGRSGLWNTLKSKKSGLNISLWLRQITGIFFSYMHCFILGLGPEGLLLAPHLNSSTCVARVEDGPCYRANGGVLCLRQGAVLEREQQFCMLCLLKRT